MQRVLCIATFFCFFSLVACSFKEKEKKPRNFEVAATDREEAERKILEDCGMVMGRGVHSTLPDEQINWAFDTHPEERIIETTEKP